MRAFENMEKKQGRRKTLTRTEHPVICSKRDDDITPEFVNDSPDRSLQSPGKHQVSPGDSRRRDPESRDIDVTGLETKSDSETEVKSEQASPKHSPHVEEDYRHFLDAIKTDGSEAVRPAESDPGSDDGGRSPSAMSTPVPGRTAGSESSAGETPGPPSESDVQQSPPKKKG